MMIKLIIMFFGQNTAEDVLCQYQNGDVLCKRTISFREPAQAVLVRLNFKRPLKTLQAFMIEPKWPRLPALRSKHKKKHLSFERYF